MLYAAVGLLVYLWTAKDFLRGEDLHSYRDVIGVALACAAIAALWPLVLGWRFLLGPALPLRDDLPLEAVPSRGPTPTTTRLPG